MNLQIIRPTLLLDEEKCRKNIAGMAAKAARNQVTFRPHFKTHVSHEVGRWFRDYGVQQITVSSLEMAEYFAADGWNDITVAFPVNILEAETINRLAERITLNLLVESNESVEFLGTHLRHPVHIFIKIDVGGNRTGISWQDKERINPVLNSITGFPLMKFRGFLTHAGHSYHAKSADEIAAVHCESTGRMKELKEAYSPDYRGLIVSTGDTPTCSIMEDFTVVDEIRPGNFVFYDLMQIQLGSCTPEEIAVAMACPVVSIHPERNEMVIYGGAIHFSKERIEDPDYGTIYGAVAEVRDPGWGKPIKGMVIKSLSQEHGIIRDFQNQLQNYRVGDLVVILPVHSCLTANAMQSYLTTGGKRLPGFRSF